MPPCQHPSLLLEPTTHQYSTAYYKKRPSLHHRTAATTPLSRIDPSTPNTNPSEDFPAPLVLPGDDLAYDPGCPPQSMRAWLRLKERNAVTPERRTIYLVAPPEVEAETDLDSITQWTEPTGPGVVKREIVEFPRLDNILAYLKAFYHGMPVKMLPGPGPFFTKDIKDDMTRKSKKGQSNRVSSKKAPVSNNIYLNTQSSEGAIAITYRPTPGGPFTHQLNLNDLLDAAIAMLPNDAYALLMVVKHDIYEDVEDDFACGRAYGGSRIAVVSGARYAPCLDKMQGVSRTVGWPASHCESCAETYGHEPADGVDDSFEMIGALRAAISAHMKLGKLDGNLRKKVLEGLWLSRVCRTAGHEIGHCFGIGHCVYYACSMQSTASVIEDARQPPYLCPVDLEKILNATGANVIDRYEAILEFCEKLGEAHLFAAYGAWIRHRMRGIAGRKTF